MNSQTQVRHKLFTSGELNLHYAVWGNGPHPLLAFHGFGRSHADFIRFTRSMTDVFTVYAFDIFFHGESHIGARVADEQPLTKDELREMIRSFIDENDFARVYLMGYSLGGRICMVIAEKISERVAGMYLFAPDGLVVNRWYALLSHYAIGRSLFRLFRRHNVLFYRILNLLYRAKVISPRVREFVTSQVETEEMQERVYRVWTFLRKIEPDFKVLGRKLTNHGVKVDLFFGLYDKIIPEKNARKFKKAFPPLRIHTLRAGHLLLTGAGGELIVREGLMQFPENKKGHE